MPRRALPLLLCTAGLVAGVPDAPGGDRAARVERGLVPISPEAGPPRWQVPGERTWTLVERMAHHKVPGVSVAVLENFQVVWAKGYGVADEARTPITPRTRFLAASISKPISALGALKLVEQGRLSLDAPINGVLKTWKLPESPAAGGVPVTLRMLLSHSAGTTVHGFMGYAQGQPLPTLTQILNGAPPANSAPVRVDLKPETRFRYSGGGTTIAQLAMMDATGEAFPALMDRLVLQPLGMADSSFVQPEGDVPALPTGYRPDGKPLPGRYHRYPEMAAAGLWTTPSDLLKAAQEVIAARQGRGKVLSAESARTMLTPRFTSSPGNRNYIGVGFFLSYRGRHGYFTHGGADEGFRCLLFVNPETGQGAAVMTNSDNGSDLATELLHALAIEYHWEGWEPTPLQPAALPPARLDALAGRYRMDGDTVLELTRTPQGLRVAGTEAGDLYAISLDTFVRRDAGWSYQPLPEGLRVLSPEGERVIPRMAAGERVPSELLKAGQHEAARAAYRALHAAQPKDPAVAEAALNNRGYDHLNAGRLPEALTLLTVATDLYPASANAWDSLGEATLKAGDKARARACYRKVLQLLPQDKGLEAGVRGALEAAARKALAGLGD
jgi:CubicO group peptidase (beta-lactamase class C family)